MNPVDDSQTMPALRLVWPLLRVVQRYRSPEKAGQRGTGYHYSNIGVEVLGLVIEKATGQALQVVWSTSDPLGERCSHVHGAR